VPPQCCPSVDISYAISPGGFLALAISRTVICIAFLPELTRPENGRERVGQLKPLDAEVDIHRLT